MRSSTSHPAESATDRETTEQPLPGGGRHESAPSGLATPKGRRALTREAPVPVVVTLLIGALAAAVSGSWFIDLHVYLLGARHAFTADLYDQKWAASGLPFTYPPFGALLMAPLGHAPFAVAAAAMTMTSFAALYLITRHTSRLVGWRLPPATLTLLALVALASEPVWATMSFGQVNLVAVALCLIDLTSRHPRLRRHRGVLTGLAAGLKLTPLFFVAYLVVTRQFRAAARTVVTFAATVAVGFVVNPHGAWTFWTSAVRDSSRVGSALYAGNQAISGVLPRVAGATVAPGVLLAAQALAAVAALAASAWVFRHGHELIAVLAAAFGMLAVSPISWSHHWVWAWPALLVLVAAGRRRRSAWVLAALWAVCFAARSMWWPPFGHDAELTWSAPERIVGDPYVVAAVMWVVWAVRDVALQGNDAGVVSPDGGGTSAPSRAPRGSTRTP